MEAKHTPGPWRVENPEQFGRDIYAGRVQVASTFYIGISHEEEGANARLIAAVPDLLAALEQIAAISWVIPAEIGRIARAAIAKATGA